MKRIHLILTSTTLTCTVAMAAYGNDQQTSSTNWAASVFNGDEFHGTGQQTGWSDADMKFWYTSTQGSRFIPLKWMQALEQAGGRGKFLAPDHMRQFQYIQTNADLPLGFVLDNWSKAEKYGTYSKPTPEKGDVWLGVSCPACHTGQITHQGKRYVVHGAPAMSDFLAFTDGVLAALKDTVNEGVGSTKYGRFADDVLGDEASADSKAALFEQLTGFVAWRTGIQTKNGNISSDQYGYGRLDAVGHILNKVSLVADGNKSQEWPSDAPVSYPHIWNASQQALVQWNGLAANSKKPLKIRGNATDFGALGRNAGEVTGVWADMNVKPSKKRQFNVHSSLDVDNLILLERTLARLPSPEWPFGIDTDLAARGQATYAEHCESCHTVLSPKDTTTKLELPIGDAPLENKIVLNWLHEAGTDIWMACNADQYGIKRNDDGEIIDPDQSAEEFGAVMLVNVVTSSLLNQGVAIAKRLGKDLFGTGGTEDTAAIRRHYPEQFDMQGVGDSKKNGKAETCLAKSLEGKQKNVDEVYLKLQEQWDGYNWFIRLFKGKQKKALKAAEADYNKYRLLRYKARPLNGIWATAPYLHNGSVPNLKALLWPSAHLDATGVIRREEDAQKRQIWRRRLSDTIPRRPDCFYVGSVEYDTDNVGYVSPSCDAPVAQTKGLYKFMVTDDAGDVIAGNSNAGHEYPVPADEVDALLEYLKTL